MVFCSSTFSLSHWLLAILLDQWVKCATRRKEEKTKCLLSATCRRIRSNSVSCRSSAASLLPETGHSPTRGSIVWISRFIYLAYSPVYLLCWVLQEINFNLCAGFGRSSTNGWLTKRALEKPNHNLSSPMSAPASDMGHFHRWPSTADAWPEVRKVFPTVKVKKAPRQSFRFISNCNAYINIQLFKIIKLI
jgi:hypothetical protein